MITKKREHAPGRRIRRSKKDDIVCSIKRVEREKKN